MTTFVTEHGAVVHINAPKPCESRTRMLKCPTCEKRRKMFQQVYEWYGASTTCLTCGEHWNDGEMSERPFMPKWREKSVAAARKRMAELGIR